MNIYYFEVQTLLIIHIFSICEFIYSIKYICNPVSIFAVLLQSFVDMQSGKKFELPDLHDLSGG